MKRLLTVALVASVLMTAVRADAQDGDKSKRASPPAKVTQKIKSGATISIDYSQPSVKGRTIGNPLEPVDGQLWRTGANEATVFETDKDVTVGGKKLSAGKYALFTLFNGKDVTVFFGKNWHRWGIPIEKKPDDVSIQTKYTTEATPSEKMTFKISPAGVVTLLWGDRKVEFTVK